MAGITHDEQGGKIILAAALMLAYTIISVGIRLQTRWPWKKMLRREDAVLLGATAVSICYTATLALAVEKGFGTRETMETAAAIHVSTIERMLSISFVLFFVTEGLGTISYGLFLMSLAEENGSHRLAMKVCCYLTAVLTGVAVVVSSVYAARRQSLSFAIWIVFGAVQATILLSLFSSIASMLLVSRMPWWKKTRAILWFGLSLALIGVIGVRLAYTPTDIFQAGFTIDAIDLLIIMIVEMHFHIINAAYPNLLIFVEKSTTGFIHGVPRSVSMNTLPHSDSSARSQKRSFSLSQTFRFPSNRPTADKTDLQSKTSYIKAAESSASDDSGDIQRG